MPRKMSKAPAAAWRAVIVTRIRSTGAEETEYLGPYWRRNDATGRVTSHRNVWRPEHSYREFVNGWVESAPLGEWKKEV